MEGWGFVAVAVGSPGLPRPPLRPAPGSLWCFVSEGILVGRGSMLAAVIDENGQLVPDVVSNELFIDRNPAFSVLLDLLRTGELHVPQRNGIRDIVLQHTKLRSKQHEILHLSST